MPSPEMFGPATLGITQGVTAFNVFLPKFTDIRKADPANNPEFAADVRMGEVAAATVTIGIGMIASSITGSSVPTVTAVVVVLMLVVLYESTLKANRPFERGSVVIPTADYIGE